MRRRVMLLAAAWTLAAATSPPDAATLSARAARRFPQPVRVGDLLGRAVLAPIESQPVLGRVEAIVRRPDTGFDLVMSRGGTFGFGERSVAVPLDATALLGEYMALMDLSPDQLDALPTAATPTASLPADDIVTMGLVRPFH